MSLPSLARKTILVFFDFLWTLIWALFTCRWTLAYRILLNFFDFLWTLIPALFTCRWTLAYQIIKRQKNAGSVPGLAVRKRRVVGIFSREDAESYRFLSKALQDSLVAEVRTSTITNNGWSNFSDDVSRCDFAILYHSKNRGRVNITTVTDSLYDEELQYLSDIRGKENVLVVADDLDSATPAEKQRILSSQTLIQEKARDLILFNKNKTTYEKQKKIEEILSYIKTEK